MEPSTGTTGIVIVDDHALFRQGLGRLLTAEPGFRVLAECSSVDEALEAIQRTPPDVVLLDVDLSTHTAYDYFERLPPGTRIPTLLVTAVTRHGEIARLMRRGARGVFSKNSGVERLPAAIRTVLAGDTFIDRAYLDVFIEAAAESKEGAAGGDQLQPAPSLREQDILMLVTRGLGNKQIATELGISEVAVKAGLQRLFRKFGVGNRAQLLAVAAGLIGSRD